MLRVRFLLIEEAQIRAAMLAAAAHNGGNQVKRAIDGVNRALRRVLPRREPEWQPPSTEKLLADMNDASHD